MGLCLGPYGCPRGGGCSYERGTPVRLMCVPGRKGGRGLVSLCDLLSGGVPIVVFIVLHILDLAGRARGCEAFIIPPTPGTMGRLSRGVHGVLESKDTHRPKGGPMLPGIALP